MERDIIRYDFSHGITKQMWGVVSQKLALLYPGIEWMSGSDIQQYFFSPDWSVFIYVVLNEDGFRLSYNNMAHDDYEEDYKGETADGLASLYIDYNETDDLFNQLNESGSKLKYNVGQTLSPTRDLYYNNSTHHVDRFMTMGKVYTIHGVEPEKNRYIIIDDRYSDHNFSEGYLEDNCIFINYDETNDLFDRLNESEENFDWVPTHEPTGVELVKVLNHYFKSIDSKYYIEFVHSNIFLSDNTGSYVSDEDYPFTLENIKNELTYTINQHPKYSIRKEYEELYKELLPFFEPTKI